MPAMAVEIGCVEDYRRLAAGSLQAEAMMLERGAVQFFGAGVAEALEVGVGEIAFEIVGHGGRHVLVD